MNTLSQLSFYSFLIQGFLFPIFIGFITVYIFKNLTKKSRSKKAKAEKNTTRQEEIKLPSLKPLKCTSCTAAVPLNILYKTCKHCNANIDIPKEYIEIGNARRDLQIKLKKAESYWRKATFFTSGWFQWFLRFTYIWLICCIIILFANDGPNQDLLFTSLTDKLGTVGHGLIVLSGISILLWILLLITIVRSIGKKTRKLLPVTEPTESNTRLTHNCSDCGAELEFKGNQLAAMCLYCGTETFRVKLAMKIKEITSGLRDKSNFSLIESMEAYEAALDDILATPSVLVFIFIILPFFIFFLPYTIYNYFAEHLLIFFVFIIVLISFFIARNYFRRKKSA